MEALSFYFENASTAVARFVEEEPLLASLVAMLLVALGLWLLAKLVRAAAVFALVVAVIAGMLVYRLGPERARGYLEQIREGPTAAERP